MAAVALFATAAYGQGQAAGGDGAMLATKIAALKGAAAPLVVTSSDFTSGGKLDDKYSFNSGNMSPSISWTRGPVGTQSYVVLTEGVSFEDGHSPVVHWVIYNIPATTTTLPRNVRNDAHLKTGALNGAEQGKSGRGAVGYVGPRPGAVGRTVPYHFEVFALDTHLNLDPDTTERPAVVNAMKNHVLTSGEIVVNYTNTGK
ncbi:MAG: YbhB/YbcL family Raf kinase inhibitor-like protein [Terracidiphilus sp.]